MSEECTKKLTFSEQYKHPLWQKRRLERLELVGFGCERCDDHDSQLHVHHKLYIKDHNLWEYADSELICLCSACHKYAHELKDELAMATTFVLDESYFEALDTAIGMFKSFDGPTWLDLKEARTAEITDGQILSVVKNSKLFECLVEFVINDVENGEIDKYGDSKSLNDVLEKLAAISRVL